MGKGVTDIQNFMICVLINSKWDTILPYPQDAPMFLSVQDLNSCWEYKVVSSISNESWINNCAGIIEL
jgi:hypothetical protein